MKKRLYKVDLYHLLGKSYPFDSSICDVESLGKIIVSASKNGGTTSRKRIGECREAIEDFMIPVVDCSTSTRYDSWYDEHVKEFYLPYVYDYWNKHKNYIVLARDLKESNIATEEDIKAYDPQKEIWYKLLREIHDKGIDFDYKKEAIEEIRKRKKQ